MRMACPAILALLLLAVPVGAQEPPESDEKPAQLVGAFWCPVLSGADERRDEEVPTLTEAEEEAIFQFPEDAETPVSRDELTILVEKEGEAVP